MTVAILAVLSLINAFMLVVVIFAAMICSHLGDLKSYTRTQIEILQNIEKASAPRAASRQAKVRHGRRSRHPRQAGEPVGLGGER